MLDTTAHLLPNLVYLNTLREGKNKAFPDQKFSDNVLSNVPDVHEFQVEPGDEFLVMACDGLWDVMSSQEVVTCLKDELVQRRTPQQAVQKLFQEAMDRNTVDNVTIVLLCFIGKSGPVQKKALTVEHRVTSALVLRDLAKQPHKRNSTFVKGPSAHSGLQNRPRKVMKKAQRIANKTTGRMHEASRSARRNDESGKILPLTHANGAPKKEAQVPSDTKNENAAGAVKEEERM